MAVQVPVGRVLDPTAVAAARQVVLRVRGADGHVAAAAPSEATPGDTAPLPAVAGPVTLLRPVAVAKPLVDVPGGLRVVSRPGGALAAGAAALGAEKPHILLLFQLDVSYQLHGCRDDAARALRQKRAGLAATAAVVIRPAVQGRRRLRIRCVAAALRPLGPPLAPAATGAASRIRTDERRKLLLVAYHIEPAYFGFLTPPVLKSLAG